MCLGGIDREGGREKGGKGKGSTRYGGEAEGGRGEQEDEVVWLSGRPSSFSFLLFFKLIFIGV